MPIVYGLGNENGAGHTEDSNGNIQVDFVWGNFPLQPNDQRDDNLDYTLDNHSIARDGWSNYPQYIPNYDGLVQFSGNEDSALLNDDTQNDGDPDPELEVVIPNFVRMTRDAASDLADGSGLQLYDFSHVLTASYVESTGKTVRVTAYDTDYGTWSNAANAALNGLQVGDELNLVELTDDADPAVNLELGVVKVTKVNNDGSDSWFEFKSATELNLDTAAGGNIYAGPNLVNIITVQRPNETAPGDIANLGRNVNVRFFSVD